MNVVTLFNTLITILFIIIVTLQALLQRTLKKSLYYYRNSVYISAILFGFVLMVALYGYLIECLTEVKSLTAYNIFREFMTFPDKFSRLALCPVMVICFLIALSNISLIRHEGYRLKNMLGFFMGIFFIGMIIVNERLVIFIENNVLYANSPFDKPIYWVLHTYGQLFVSLMICYLEVFFLSTVIMAYLAAKQVPKYDKDYIIILGCSIDKKGGLLPLLKARTNRAIKYAWQQEIATSRPVKFVPSGGQGPNEIISEGSAMEMYLLTHGAEEHEIIAEKQSRNTYENFLFSKKLIAEQNPDARICFATTNYHIYRSGIIARKMGIDIEGIASTTRWYFWPNGFLREFIAILAMEKKLHLAVTALIAAGCILLGFVSYSVFKVYLI